MPFSLDHEVAAARRRIEAVRSSIDVAQQIPDGIRTVDYHTKSADGAGIRLPWYTTDCVQRGPAVDAMVLDIFRDEDIDYQTLARQRNLNSAHATLGSPAAPGTVRQLPGTRGPSTTGGCSNMLSDRHASGYGLPRVTPTT